MTNETPSKPEKKTWDDYIVGFFRPIWRNIKEITWALLFISLFLFAYLFDSIFINIYPGNTGVLWKRFAGGTQDEIFTSGLHIISPFDKMYIYETRIQQKKVEFTALSNSGVTIRLNASVRFFPHIASLPTLHESLGPDYIDRVVVPEIKSVLRQIIGTLNFMEIYNGQHENQVEVLADEAMKQLKPQYIVLSNLLIKEIHLPEMLSDAIQAKLKEQQKFKAYSFINQTAQMEADRKLIEAKGIAAYQETVNKGLTSEYLSFRGIQATLELAKSENAKVVIIGNKEGLPLILNTGNDLNPASMGGSESNASQLPQKQSDFGHVDHKDLVTTKKAKPSLIVE